MYGFGVVLLYVVLSALHSSAPTSCCLGTEKTFIFTCYSSTLKTSSPFSKYMSILLVGCTYERFANCSITVVDLASPMPSVWKIDLGIKLMLAPGSHKALLD
ncbi:hypothetical protein V6N13_001986 [Hibiscus sabdariffa]